VTKANDAGFGQRLSKSDKYCQSGRLMRTASCLFDTELLDAVTQLTKRKSEYLRRGGFVVPGTLQGIDDGLPLYSLELVTKVRNGPLL
jgi:hypothetical protein